MSSEDKTQDEVVWTNADSALARREGWDLFVFDGVFYDIQRCDDDESEQQPEDSAAIAFVFWQATVGSSLHQKAMAICLSEENVKLAKAHLPPQQVENQRKRREKAVKEKYTARQLIDECSMEIKVLPNSAVVYRWWPTSSLQYESNQLRNMPEELCESFKLILEEAGLEITGEGLTHDSVSRKEPK